MIETKTPPSRTLDASQCGRIKVVLRPAAAPGQARLAAAPAMPAYGESLTKLVENAESIAQEKKRDAEIRRLEAEAARARFAAD